MRIAIIKFGWLKHKHKNTNIHIAHNLFRRAVNENVPNKSRKCRSTGRLNQDGSMVGWLGLKFRLFCFTPRLWLYSFGRKNVKHSATSTFLRLNFFFHRLLLALYILHLFIYNLSNGKYIWSGMWIADSWSSLKHAWSIVLNMRIAVTCKSVSLRLE